MKPDPIKKDTVKTAVRERYGNIAAQGGGCCSPSSCCEVESNIETLGHDPTGASRLLGYSDDELAGVPSGANLGLGCGNPQAIASLQPGETVVDLGSGAGFDSFLAAQAVGESGQVIGVDMTPEMVSKARHHQETSGMPQVEFRLGEIEALPVADGSVDVIISNCVINLSPDKPRVFREAFRVLKPGGRLAISDVVALASIPTELQEDWDALTGCIAGASTVQDLKILLSDVGFSEIRITRKGESRDIVEGWLPGRNVGDYVASASIEAIKP